MKRRFFFETQESQVKNSNRDKDHKLCPPYLGFISCVKLLISELIGKSKIMCFKYFVSARNFFLYSIVLVEITSSFIFFNYPPFQVSLLPQDFAHNFDYYLIFVRVSFTRF